VFHVYDQLHLDRIPRRYTVEAGKSLTDHWATAPDGGEYNLWVYGPNSFVRTFSGNSVAWIAATFRPEIEIVYNSAASQLVIQARNSGAHAGAISIAPNHSYFGSASQTLTIPANSNADLTLNLAKSANWYDFSAAAANFTRRFAGRMETGYHGISNPVTVGG
jgi:phospholipase C